MDIYCWCWVIVQIWGRHSTKHTAFLVQLPFPWFLLLLFLLLPPLFLSFSSPLLFLLLPLLLLVCVLLFISSSPPAFLLLVASWTAVQMCAGLNHMLRPAFTLASRKGATQDGVNGVDVWGRAEVGVSGVVVGGNCMSWKADPMAVVSLGRQSVSGATGPLAAMTLWSSEGLLTLHQFLKLITSLQSICPHQQILCPPFPLTQLLTPSPRVYIFLSSPS